MDAAKHSIEREYTVEDIYALPEGQRAELIDGRWYDANYYSTITNIYNALTGKDKFDSDKYIAEQKQFIKQFDSYVTIKYEGPTDEEGRKSKEKTGKGSYYTMSISGTPTAFIYEFSTSTNDTLESAKKTYTAYEATTVLESLKYNVDDYYSDEDDYVKRNTNYYKYGYDALKACPIIGDYVGLFGDVTGFVSDGVEYLSSNETDDKKSNLSDTIDETLDTASDIVSDPAKLVESDSGKKKQKKAKTALKFTKIGVGAYQDSEDLRDEYQKKKAHDEEINELISEIKHNNVDVAVDKIIEENSQSIDYTIDEEHEGHDIVPYQRFSFTIHTDGRCIVSNNRVSQFKSKNF